MRGVRLEMDAVCLSWSSGKDSALALHQLQQMKGLRVTHLLTTLAEPYQRVSMHGVRRALLHAQAEALGLPLVEVMLPDPCPMETYNAVMHATLERLKAEGIRTVAFGDLFLEDIRAYREERLALAGMRGLFPLWGQDTRELASRCLAAGFRAAVVVVDTERLDRSFCGRPYDEGFIADLPPGVDPCGERGEFHTFVYDGPIFRHPVRFSYGHIEDRGRFVYQELIPEA